MRPMLLFLLIETLYFTITILHLMYFVKTAQYCYTLLVYYYYYYYYYFFNETRIRIDNW